MKGRVVLMDKDQDDRDARAIAEAVDLDQGNRQVAHGIDASCVRSISDPFLLISDRARPPCPGPLPGHGVPCEGTP